MQCLRQNQCSFNAGIRIRSLAKTKACSTYSLPSLMTRPHLIFPTMLFNVHTLSLCSSLSNYNMHIFYDTLKVKTQLIQMAMWQWWWERQYLPLNTEPSVHKCWSVTQDQAAAHQIRCRFPLDSLKPQVLLLIPCQPRFVSSNEGCEW